MIANCTECKAEGIATYTVTQEGKEDRCVCPACAKKLGLMSGVHIIDDHFEPQDTIMDRIDRFFGRMGRHMRGYK